MSLRTKTVNGMIWHGFSVISEQGLQTLVNIILARILLPSDFGLIAMINVFAGFISIVNRLGLTGAIVHKKDIKERHLSSIFWFSQAEGISLFILSIFSAPLIANFYNQPILKPIFIYLAINFVLSSTTSVHLALLDKKLQFKKAFLPEVSKVLIMGVVAIGLALNDFGVWSLVWGSVVSVFVSSVLYWFVSSWRPKFLFDFRSVWEILGYGTKVMSQQIINFFGSNIDFLIVGKVLGAIPLGYYNLAFGLTTFPQRKFIQLVNRVTFPSFSRVQEENHRLRSGYLEIVKYLSVITYPFIFGLFAVAPELVRIVYTSKWEGAILPLQILCLGSLFSLTTSPTGPILLAKGRAGLAAKLSLFRLMLLAVSVYFGSRFGIVGVAVAVSGCFVFFNSFFLHITHSLIDLKMKELFLTIGPSVFASMIMAGGILFFRVVDSLYFNLSDLIFLIISLIGGVALYFVSLKKISPHFLHEVKGLIYEFKPKWFSFYKLLKIIKK